MPRSPKLETYKLFFEQAPEETEVIKKISKKSLKALKPKQNLLETPKLSSS